MKHDDITITSAAVTTTASPAPSNVYYSVESNINSVVVEREMIELPSFPDWLNKSLVEICKIKKLLPNWDFDNSPTPSEKICNNLEKMFIRNHTIINLPMPFIVPMSNGGIYIRFNYRNRELMIEFDDTSGIMATCLWAEKVTHGEDAHARRIPLKHNFNLLIKWLLGLIETVSSKEEISKTYHYMNKESQTRSKEDIVTAMI